MVLRGRKSFLLSVYRSTRRSKNDFLQARVFARFEQIDKTENIDAGIEGRIRHGMTHVHLRRVMAENFRFDLFETCCRAALRNIDLVQFCFGIEVRRLPGGKIIEDMHLVTALQIRIDNVGPDKPRAPCDNDFHAFCS